MFQSGRRINHASYHESLIHYICMPILASYFKKKKGLRENYSPLSILMVLSLISVEVDQVAQRRAPPLLTI